MYFAVDSINYSSESLVSNTTTGATQFGDQDDSLTVTFGGNYDFEVVKLYAGAQYFDEIKTSKMKGVIQDVDKFNSGDTVGFADRMKGWSLVCLPVFLLQAVPSWLALHTWTQKRLTQNPPKKLATTN